MKRSLCRPIIVVFAAFALLLAAAIALLPSPPSAQPPADEASGRRGVLPQEGCELLQTITYARCGHALTRRSPAPAELLDQPLEQVQALYDDWRVTEFSSGLITMEKRLELFCPDHLVLMPDGAGMLCVFQNKYGDAMALVNELSLALKDLPAAAREEAQRGVGFATAQELEMWLESAES